MKNLNMELDLDQPVTRLDGLDEAVIGTVERLGSPTVLLYDEDKIIEILMRRDSMSKEEAIDFFAFNIANAWLGYTTPAFARLF
jgi:hypothetical protein